MSQQKITKYVNWALKIILYVTLITPLLIWSNTLFPFITGKTIFFRIMIEIAIVLYTALALLDKKFCPQMSKLSWLIVIFGAIIFITGLTGVDFYKTFWGTIERGEGFLTISHLIIFFLILSWTFKTKKEWLNYLTGLVFVGVLIHGYAILQRLNVEKFLFWRIIHSGEGRLSATIGNAAFMGAFALAQLWLSLLLFLQRKKIVWKIVFAFTAVLSFFILFQTQTRGALLSLFFTALALTIFCAIKHPHKTKRRISLGILIAIILVAGFIFLNKNSNWVQSSTTLRRLVHISRDDITTESRLLAWQSSWKGWKDSFVLGYGWENYNIAFNKYFPAQIFKDSGSQLWFDRAHNTIFDVAVATGIFGLINYLLIFGIALFYLFKKIKRDFEVSVILIALLIAHFLQNIFVFDVLSTYIILFSVFAFVNFSSFDKPAQIEEAEVRYTKFNYLIFIIILLLVILGIYNFNLQPLKANEAGVEGLILAGQNKEKEALNSFTAAIEMQTYQTPEIRQKLADNLLLYNKTQNNLTQQEVYDNFKIGIQQVKNNITEHPLDVQNHLYLLALLNKAAVYDPGYYNQVLEYAEQALKLSPTRPQIYFEMGQATISTGNIEQAIEYFQKGVDLYPENLESHWNLLTAYIVSGKQELAQKEYEYMEERGFNFNTVANLNRLYNVYLFVNNNQKLVEILNKVIEIQPNAINYARLAAVYKQLGNYAAARQAVAKAVELDPSLASEAELFLQTLGE